MASMTTASPRTGEIYPVGLGASDGPLLPREAEGVFGVGMDAGSNESAPDC